MSLNKVSLKATFTFIIASLIYAGLAQFGLLFVSFNSHASPLWPATGFAFFIVHTFGFRYSPAIALGALAVSLFHGDSLFLGGMIALGNTLEAIAGTWIFARVLTRLRSQFEYQSETAGYFGAAIVGASVSVCFGITSLWIAGVIPTAEVANAGITWWGGNVLGVMTLAPALNEFFRSLRHMKKWNLTKISKVICFFAFGALLFYSLFQLPSGPSFVFFTFPFLLGAVVWFGSKAGKYTSLMLSAGLVWLHVRGEGPFTFGSINQNFLHLQLFIAAIAITALMLQGFKRAGSLRLPAMVLVIGWMFAGAFFYSFDRAERDKSNIALNEAIADIHSTISYRMASYEEALRSGLSLYMSSESVKPNEWKELVKALKIDQRYPGILGLGTVIPVDINNLNHVRHLPLHTVPESTLSHAAKTYNNHYVINLIEPLERHSVALGLDVGSSAERRWAAERSRDSGEVAMTTSIRLVHDKKHRSGFLMFMPMYKKGTHAETPEARRANFDRWIYAPFVIDEVLAGVLGRESKKLDLYLFDSSIPDFNNLIYSSSAGFREQAEPPKFVRVTKLIVGQREFSLGWSLVRGFNPQGGLITAWIGFFGAIFTLFFANLVVGLQTINRRANFIADEKNELLATREKNLRESREQFDLAVLGSRDGLWDYKVETGEIYYSPRWKEMLGYEDHELKNTAEIWPLLCHPQDQAYVNRRFLKFLNGKRNELELECRLRHKDGSYRWILVRGMSLRNAEGKIYRVAGSQSDITERKKSEFELIEAKESALEGARTKSEFLANMSHEIRTPLNGIMGMIDLLKESPLMPDQLDYAETIHQSADSLRSIIDDILDFSKIEAGKLDVEVIEFDLRATIEDTLKLMSYSAKKKGIQLEWEVPSKMPSTFYGDPSRIRQVITNLLSNAIKFTDVGCVKFRLDILQDGFEECKMHFAISDTGIGIPEMALEKIFSAFAQADTSTTRKFGGTGLGLSISKKLIELMDGKIGADSLVGRGSTFWFELNLKKGAGLSVSSNPPEQTIYALSRARILIVEDNPVNQKVAELLLKKMGYMVLSVSNGKQALEVLAESDFDLILMDVQMPEMDGYEATMRIRENPDLGGADIPIVAMTANALDGDRRKCLDVGMDDYVSKPVHKDTLFSTIEKWLSGKDTVPLRVKKSSGPKVIDYSVIESLVNHSVAQEKALLFKLIDLYMKEAPAQLDTIKTALKAREFNLVKKEAHSLKSSSGNLGLQRVAETCRGIETSAADSIGEFESQIAVLKKEVAIAMEVLEELMSRAA